MGVAGRSETDELPRERGQIGKLLRVMEAKFLTTGDGTRKSGKKTEINPREGDILV